jgi:predicted ATPase
MILLAAITAFPEITAQEVQGNSLGGFQETFLTVALTVGGVVCVVAVLYLVRFFLHRRFRERRGFQKRVLLVTVPKESAEKKNEQERGKTLQENQEDISVAEALYATIGGLRADRSISGWFTGREDDFAFELVAKDGLISFYIAVPERLEEFITQQVQALYPYAQVEVVEDYNLFIPQGVIVGAYLTLHKHHFFPLKTFRKIESDPLNAMTNALAKVEKTSGAAVQIVIRSAKREWRHKGTKIATELQKGKSIQQAIASTTLFGSLFGGGAQKKKPNEAPEPNRTLSPAEQEMQKGIQEKLSKAGLDATIRVVVSAPDATRARLTLDNITNTFSQYNLYEFGNSFVKVVPSFQSRMIREYIYRTFDERHSIVLSADEMASLYHFPLPTTETPNIRWLTARKSAPPVNLPEEGVTLGTVEYRGEKNTVKIRRNDRRRHLYVIGKSGSGKSVFIENLALQDIRNGDGVCVVDPHGDLVEHILEQMPRERIDDVIVFDPSDIERPMGLNMLEVDRDEQKDFTVQEMIAIFYKLFPPEMIGPMFEHNMRNVMLTLMADPATAGTIAEIPRMFSDADFQKRWVEKLTDPVVRAFWEKEMAKTSDFHKSEMLGYLISKVGRFVENEMMRNIIGQQQSSFNIRQVMDQKKILLVNLAKGRTGEVNANLLGLIIVSKLQMAALGRADLPESERHDFYLYIDEFQNFITDSIATILSEARKYRLCLTIAHQYMGQLVQNNDTKIRDAVIGNVGTIALFRIGIDDAEALEKEFAPTFNAYDLINVPQYTAYVKLLIDNTASRPFNMNTLPPQKGDPKLAAAIKQLSRLKYGRDRASVEAEILERTQLGVAAPSQAAPERTL